MKTFLALAFVVLLALILFNRQRVFLRDPLATVYRDNVKQSGVQVYINNSNDVLLEKDSEPGSYRTLVQHWNQAPGTPVVLRCMRWMACLTDADHATIHPMRSKYVASVSMTNREVSFVDGDGALMHVALR